MYATMTIRELKEEARGKVSGFSKMTKAALIAELEAFDLAQAQAAQVLEASTESETVDWTIAELEPVVIQTPPAKPVRAIDEVKPKTDRPTWADVIATLKLIIAAMIATAIYAGRKAGRAARSPKAMQWLEWAHFVVNAVNSTTKAYIDPALRHVHITG